MRYSKYLAVAVLMCFGALAVQNEVRADLTPNQIVSDFNGMNSGNGLSFTFSSLLNESNLANNSGATFAPTGAYTIQTGTASYFRSFCIDSGDIINAGQKYNGTLNYNGSSTVNSNGQALSVGAAYLYKQYATGALSGYNYSNRSASATAMQQALYFLTGQASTATWTNNTFLQHLLTLNSDQSFWTANYNPGQFYSVIGDFSVFVMQVTHATTGVNAQDFLYVARASFGGDGQVPEPATVLLWLLGGVGSMGAAYVKRRRKIAYA